MNNMSGKIGKQQCLRMYVKTHKRVLNATHFVDIFLQYWRKPVSWST